MREINSDRKGEGWMGDDDLAAFLTDAGYILMERRKGGIDYTIMGKDFLLLEEGYLPQPVADIDLLAADVAKERNLTITRREAYDMVVINYVCGNIG